MSNKKYWKYSRTIFFPKKTLFSFLFLVHASITTAQQESDFFEKVPYILSYVFSEIFPSTVERDQSFKELTGYDWFLDKRFGESDTTLLFMNEGSDEIINAILASDICMIIFATIDGNEEKTVTLESQVVRGDFNENKLKKFVKESADRWLSRSFTNIKSVNAALKNAEDEIQKRVLEDLGKEEIENSTPQDTIHVAWQVDSVFISDSKIIASGDRPEENIGFVPSKGTITIVDLVGSQWIVDSDGNVTRIESDEGKDDEEEKLVTIIPITDTDFAAGIDSDKLTIGYSITPTDEQPLAYAKLEIFKNDGSLAYVNTADTKIGKDQEFKWNGEINQNVNETDKVFIRSDESPFNVKITASEKEGFAKGVFAETEGSVNPYVDSFLDNYEVAKHIEAGSDADKFDYYLQLQGFMYDKISSDGKDEEVVEGFDNTLDYLGEKVRERTFLGRTITVHDHYWAYLEGLDKKLTKYHNHSNYTMGGFSIRFQRGSNDKVSNHAYAMALDVKAERNPYIAKKSLHILYLFTQFDFIQNPSTPEDLKNAHNKLIGVGYELADIKLMQNGFEYLHTNNKLVSQDFGSMIGSLLAAYKEYEITFSQLRNRNSYLRNEILLLNQKTQQEKEAIEEELFVDLPKAADKLLATIKALKSDQELEELNNLYQQGYQNAFALSKHLPDQYLDLTNALLSLSLQSYFGFEEAIVSLMQASARPSNNDYTNWTTLAEIVEHDAIPTRDDFDEIIKLISEQKTKTLGVFSTYNATADYLQSSNSSLTKLTKDGFMLMSADFARAFIDTKNSGGKQVIGWGGNWKDLKDFMHLEYIEKDKF